MDQCHEGSDLLHLVTLQAANKMPLNIHRQLPLLLHQLLHTTLTEEPLTGTIRLADLFYGWNFDTATTLTCGGSDSFRVRICKAMFIPSPWLYYLRNREKHP